MLSKSKFVLLIVVVVLIGLHGASAQNPASVRIKAEAALTAGKAGNYVQAIKLYKEILSTEGNKPLFLYLLAETQVDMANSGIQPLEDRIALLSEAQHHLDTLMADSSNSATSLPYYDKMVQLGATILNETEALHTQQERERIESQKKMERDSHEAEVARIRDSTLIAQAYVSRRNGEVIASIFPHVCFPFSSESEDDSKGFFTPGLEISIRQMIWANQASLQGHYLDQNNVAFSILGGFEYTRLFNFSGGNNTGISSTLFFLAPGIQYGLMNFSVYESFKNSTSSRYVLRHLPSSIRPDYLSSIQDTPPSDVALSNEGYFVNQSFGLQATFAFQDTDQTESIDSRSSSFIRLRWIPSHDSMHDHVSFEYAWRGTGMLGVGIKIGISDVPSIPSGNFMQVFDGGLSMNFTTPW